VTIITTVCRRCRVEFEPGREAIVAGTWRLCPECRDRSTNALGSLGYPQCR
jgi:hypothetical protein